jgi:hypothetical protein
MSRIIHLIDRSRVEAREECPRLRFLGYDFDGDGLDSEEASLPLLSGIAMHAAFARLLAGQPLEAIVESVISDYVAEINARGLYGLEVTKTIIKEQSALLEGMLRVWAVVRMPIILDEYDVVSIEQTWDWELSPGLVQRIRMDVILRRKDDGLLFIFDFKTMKYPSELFEKQKEHDLQTCLYVQALKERTGEPVGGVLYEGLIKGRFAKETTQSVPWSGQKVQLSPYTMAYALKSDIGAIYQTDYTNRKGFRKVRIVDEMSQKDWVENYLLAGGAGMISPNELFVSMPPVMPTPFELARIKQQVIREETQYHDQLGTISGTARSRGCGQGPRWHRGESTRYLRADSHWPVLQVWAREPVQVHLGLFQPRRAAARSGLGLHQAEATPRYRFGVCRMTDEKVHEVVERYRNRLAAFADTKYPFELNHRLSRQDDWPEFHALIKAAKMLDSIDQFIRESRREKAFRWLGFVQGVLFTTGVYSIEEMANHNRPVEPAIA